MSLTLEEFAERLQKGESPADIVVATTPPAIRELVRRCALTPRFDREVAGWLGEGLDPRPDVEALTRRPEIEPAPRAAGLFRVRPAERTKYLDEWLESRDEHPLFRELHGKLAELWQARGERELAFYHLLPVDSAAAWRLFDELYQDADRRFDLARCHDLNELAAELKELFTREELDRHYERERYLQSRRFWSRSYYRTVRFYERPRLTERLERLLARSPATPILQLHAGGGMGKTLFLHWAIAHRAVPRRIPCALLDFDEVRTADEAEVWKLLLRFAEQLDRQLPQSPFDYLVREAREAEQTLRHQQGSEDPFHDLIAGIPERFGIKLADADLDRPVLLVLDTLEEGLLRHDVDFVALFDAFATIHGLCPWARLVLSGRYDLRQRVAGLEGRLDDRATLEVGRFEPAEARGYLRARGVTDERRIAAMIQKSDLVPFKLALYGDLLRAEPDLEIDKILGYPDADLLYLVQRVIRRIDNPGVRWLVRYGVIPRQLTLEFVDQVVVDYLSRAMAGKVEYDDPEIDLKALPAALREADLFPHSEKRQARRELIALWNELHRYASASSWVYEAPGHPSALQFHVSVLEPMRNLLERHEVSRLLHEAAAEYFERQAREEPERRTAHLREAVYHRFQGEGAAARRYWRRWLGEAAEHQDFEARLELAGEVLGPEYVDPETELPRKRRGAGVIDPATLADACHELAVAALALARHGSADPLMKKAQGAYRRLRCFEQQLPEPRVPAAARHLVEGRIEAWSGRFEKALAAVERGLATAAEADPETRRDLNALAGDLLLRLRRQGYHEYYKLALDDAREDRRATDEAVAITERLVQSLAEDGLFGRALKEAERTLATAASPESRERASLLLAATAQRSGLPVQAYRVADRLRREGVHPTRTARVRWLLGRSELACLRLRLAREHADSALYAVDEDDVDLRARVLELRGQAEARLGDSASLATLAEARSLFQSLGAIEDAARCLRRCIEFELFEIGDLRSAGSMIDEGRRFRLEPGSEMAVAFQALQIAWSTLRGEPDRARRLAEELRAAPEGGESLAAATRRLLAVFAWSEPAATDLRALVELLARVDTPPGRIARCRGLDRCRTAAFSSDLRYRLAELVPRISGCDLPGLDGILYDLGAAEALRIGGLAAVVSERLDGVRRRLEEEEPSHALIWRELWRANARAGLPEPPEKDLGWLRQLADEFAESPLLVAAAAIERLERRKGRPIPWLLEIAEQALARVERTTVWQARLAILQARSRRLPRRLALERATEIHAQLGQPPPEPAAADRDVPPERTRGGRWRSYEPGRGASDDELDVSLGEAVLPLHPDPLSLALTVRLARIESPWRCLRTTIEGWSGKTSEIDLKLEFSLLPPADSGTIFSRDILLELRDDWSRLGQRMGELLTPPDPSTPSGQVDLRLELADPALCYLPWELAPFNRWQWLRCFYRAADPELARSHPSRWRERRRRPPRILVLQPSRKRMTLDQRGFDFGGASAERLYKRQGFDVVVLREPTLKAFANAVAENRPDVIHVNCEVRESTSFGALSLDFGVAEKEVLEPSLFEWTLQDVPPELRPTVVLDVGAPPGETETWRQLLLRNAYAGALFEKGSVPAIVAAGLGRDPVRASMNKLLADGLRRGDTIGEICDQLRRISDYEPGEAPASLATALFAHDPDFRPIPPGDEDA